MTEYGNSRTCGPPCDSLLKLRKGVSWHMLAIQLAIAELRPDAGEGHRSRRLAWDAVYGEGSWKHSAHAIFSRDDVVASYVYHTRAATEDVVEFKRRLEAQLEEESLFDMTRLFDQREEVDPKVLGEMVRMVLEGIRDPEVAAVNVENLLESGRPQSYGAQRRPPTFDELVRKAEYLIRLRLKPLAELERLGWGKMITRLSHDRRGRWTVEVDRRHSRQLIAQMTSLIDNRITLDVAEQHAAAAILRLQEITHEALQALSEDSDSADGSRANAVAFVQKWAGKLAVSEYALDPTGTKRWEAFAANATGRLQDIETLVVTWGKGSGR